MALAALLVTACTPEVEDKFDQSSAKRAEEAITQTQQLLTSNKAGWVMHYYGRLDLGGYNLLCQFDGDKVYAFTVAFGAETDTLDLEGQVIGVSDVRPTLAEVEAVLPRFTGPIEQVPPAYSAIMVDGARAYDLARAGQEVELNGG